MPVSHRVWLVSYDISEPRRLSRVARFMVRHGIRLQYSVFAVVMDQQELAALREGVAALIDPARDDIRIYPIAAQGRCDIQGASLVPPEMLPHHEAFGQLHLPLSSATAARGVAQ